MGVRRPLFGLLTGLLLCLGTDLASRDQAPAADLDGPPAAASSQASPITQEGPEWLKTQVRVTVETNLPAGATETNVAAPGGKWFHWNAEWHGWNGLYLELTRKTFLGRALPGVTNFEQLHLRARQEKLLTGTNAQTATKLFHLEEDRMTAKIGGKFAVDAATYATGSQFQGFEPGVELRRAFLYAKGDCLLLFPVSYSIQLGYNANQFFLDETYLKFQNIPWIGDFKAGGFKAPMSLEQLTSSRDITLMEPAAPIQALTPGNSAGFQIGRPVFDKRATWTLGLFTDGVGFDYGDASKDYGRAIVRFTGVPFLNQGENSSPSLLHLGLSANVLYSGNSTVRYRSRPESHLAPYVVDTGNISAEGALVVGTEIAWVNGPFSIQGEAMNSWVHETDGDIPDFDGFYVSASWFLTGESRPYSPAQGIFDRVRPHHNLTFHDGGWGAWELAARVSHLDLDSQNVHGGRVDMLMTGLNWYLNPHVKWRFNYGFGKVRDRTPAGNINVFQTRIEVDF